MKNIAFLLLVSVTSLLAYGKPPELGKYPLIFRSSPGDYTVTILRLGPESENTFLVKVDGLDNKHDGKIYKHTKKCMNTSCDQYYLATTQVNEDKKSRNTLYSMKSWGTWSSLKFFPPGMREEHQLSQLARPNNFDSKGFYYQYSGQTTKSNNK